MYLHLWRHRHVVVIVSAAYAFDVHHRDFPRRDPFSSDETVFISLRNPPTQATARAAFLVQTRQECRPLPPRAAPESRLRSPKAPRVTFENHSRHWS